MSISMSPEINYCNCQTSKAAFKQFPADGQSEILPYGYYCRHPIVQSIVLLATQKKILATQATE